jgi:DNA ligase-1
MNPSEWRENLTFQVFDLIDTENPFAERMNILRSKISKDHSFIKIVPQTIVQKDFDLFGLLDRVCANGEEGLMLKKVNEHYEHRRSPYLLKMKQFHDTEVIITAFIEGKGKHRGGMGALLIKDKDGNTCKIGSGFSDQERKNPPFKIGDEITMKYFERCNPDKKTGNISYRFPTFLKVKHVMEGGVML